MTDGTPTTYASRDQIPEKYRWDTTSLFCDDEAFLAALEQAQTLPAQIEGWKDQAFASGERLLAYLRFEDDARQALNRLSEYASRRSDEDTRVSKYQEYRARVTTLLTRVSAAGAWFGPALLELDEAVLGQWYEEVEGLSLYRLALGRILDQRAHVLTPAEEALLASAGEMAAQPELQHSMLNDADLTFPDATDERGEAHSLTGGSFVPLQMGHDRVLREDAYHKYYQAYRGVRNTSAALLAAQMRQLKFFSQARRYESLLEASLAPTEVPTHVYQSLIASVHKGLPALHRYLALRKKVLGVDELRFWDMYVPIVEADERTYTYEEAVELVLEALKPLGEEYVSIARHGLENRWVDVFETPGKAGGAYSSGLGGLEPLILLNYQGTLDDVFTLAHELGHSMQTYFSGKKQSVRYADYPMFVAEVASTTNECLLLNHLLTKAKDDSERAFLLNHYLEQFRGTLFRQTLFAEFERDVSAACEAGDGLGADDFCERYRALNESYYEGVVVDDDIAHEWSRIPHFFYDFYVYVYATSFAAAVALSERMLSEGASAVGDYLEFLAGGCSKTPIELLRGAGVDMESGAAVDAALGRFAAVVSELEELLG